MTHITVITSKKGGVTKTTTAVNLAARLAGEGKDTLLIDFDPQGQTAILLGMDQGPGPFALFVQQMPSHCLTHHTSRASLWILPSNQRTNQAVNFLNQEIASGETSRAGLVAILRVLGQEFEHVVIDTPASGILQEIALAAADTVVIPVSLDYLGMDGLRNTLAAIQKLERDDLQKIILPTLNAPTREAEYNLSLLGEAYPDALAQPVRASAAVREACASGRTVWEHHDRHSDTLASVREAYERLAWQILGQPKERENS